ncbi:MAG TPA: aspartate aminotransferase family protein [Pirellulaceae bacterium]|nr:aspartate aminotransferase family protein [Pirellulaceae bacterium]
MSNVLAQYETAQQYLAGGISSSTRLNKAIGHPLYIDRAKGCRVWGLDGKEYIDLCCSHGATLLGHGDERISAAIRRAMERGAPCSYENETHALLAKQLCQAVPCLERVRFTGSGTEATMHCIRLARAVTGKTKLLRFEGNFHGYHDQVMFASVDPACRAGSKDDSALSERSRPAGGTYLSPISAGVPAQLGEQLIQIPYNRPDILEEIIPRHAHELAAAICEPIWYNAGCILPTKEFITTLRRLTEQHGMVLIFDEVLSAFRMAPGGAQEYLGITPDLCTLGKAVGGGYPLSVFGGRRDLMARLMPQGDCQHSGTYNGHPSVVAAGLAAVQAYRSPGFYDHIRAVGQRLFAGLSEIFTRRGIPARVQGLGARFGIYFGLTEEVTSYDQVQRHSREQMLGFIAAAIEHGVYFHDYGGAACHHGFCQAMTLGDVEEALERLDAAVATI